MYFLVVWFMYVLFCYFFLQKLSRLVDSVKPVTQSLSTQSSSQWQSIDSVPSQLTWIVNPFDSVYLCGKMNWFTVPKQSNWLVYKSGATSSVRPVFDAPACVPDGASFNDCLEMESSLISWLDDVLLGFSRHKYAAQVISAKHFCRYLCAQRTETVSACCVSS